VRLRVPLGQRLVERDADDQRIGAAAWDPEQLAHGRDMRLPSPPANPLGDVEDEVDLRVEQRLAVTDADRLAAVRAQRAFERLDRLDRVEFLELVAMGGRILGLEVVRQSDAAGQRTRPTFFLMFTPRGVSRIGCGSNRSDVRLSSRAMPRSFALSRSSQRSHSCGCDGTSS